MYRGCPILFGYRVFAPFILNLLKDEYPIAEQNRRVAGKLGRQTGYFPPPQALVGDTDNSVK